MYIVENRHITNDSIVLTPLKKENKDLGEKLAGRALLLKVKYFQGHINLYDCFL